MIKEAYERNRFANEDKLRVEQAIIYLSKKLSFESEKDDYNFRKGQINWLKSLRPQSQWKPSKEQIEEFKYLLDDSNWDGEVLVSLYND